MFQAEGTISQCKVTWAGKKEKEISRSRTVSTGEGARVGGGRESRTTRKEGRVWISLQPKPWKH